MNYSLLIENVVTLFVTLVLLVNPAQWKMLQLQILYIHTSHIRYFTHVEIENKAFTFNNQPGYILGVFTDYQQHA